jgi:holo-[acyl-carrier protein] synthase
MQIGTDIIAINRLEKSIDKFGDRFKEKFLTPLEIENTKKIESLAGLWASKEAISKALGCGICKDLTFQDIIITKDSRGKPSFTLSDKSQNIFKIKSSSLSISHDGGFAIAVVIISL